MTNSRPEVFVQVESHELVDVPAKHGPRKPDMVILENKSDLNHSDSDFDDDGRDSRGQAGPEQSCTSGAK